MTDRAWSPDLERAQRRYLAAVAVVVQDRRVFGSVDRDLAHRVAEAAREFRWWQSQSRVLRAGVLLYGS